MNRLKNKISQSRGNQCTNIFGRILWPIFRRWQRTHADIFFRYIATIRIYSDYTIYFVLMPNRILHNSGRNSFHLLKSANRSPFTVEGSASTFYNIFDHYIIWSTQGSYYSDLYFLPAATAEPTIAFETHCARHLAGSYLRVLHALSISIEQMAQLYYLKSQA